MNNLEMARSLLENDGFTCALCKGEKFYTSRLRGVRPLIELLESGEDFSGFSAADKVVGNGAAFLYVLLSVSEVYAPVISRAAADTLEKNGIAVSCGSTVDNISNRTGDGLCPMEQAVKEITDPLQALAAIKEKMRQLHAK